MVSCLSCGMSHKARRQGVRFYRLPKNPAQRKAWLKFANRNEDNVPKLCYLCSCHFQEDDVDRTSSFRVTLRKNAVPTKVVLRAKYSRDRLIRRVQAATLDEMEGMNDGVDSKCEEILKSDKTPPRSFNKKTKRLKLFRDVLINVDIPQKKLRKSGKFRDKHKSREIKRLRTENMWLKEKISCLGQTFGNGYDVIYLLPKVEFKQQINMEHCYARNLDGLDPVDMEDPLKIHPEDLVSIKEETEDFVVFPFE